MATWLIRKLGISRFVKGLLILTVWLLATTFIPTEID